MKEILSLAAETAGWIGALGTAAAYALVSRRRIAPDSTAFQSLNMLGAGLLAVSAASSGAWPAVAANSVWILISVQALVGARALGTAAVRLGRWLRPRRAGGDGGAETGDPGTVTALHPVPVPGPEALTPAPHLN